MMTVPAILWTPVDPAGTVNTITFPHGLTIFRGNLQADVARDVSQAGYMSAVVHDGFWRFTAELRGVNYQNSSHYQFFQQAHAWLSHASRSGTFGFSLDSSRIFDVTTSSITTQGASAVTHGGSALSATTEVAGAWLRFSDFDDPSHQAVARISSYSTATNVWTLTNALTRGFTRTSSVNPWGYFVSCILEDGEFVERPAGQGSPKFDLSFTFRTVSN